MTVVEPAPRPAPRHPARPNVGDVYRVTCDDQTGRRTTVDVPVLDVVRLHSGDFRLTFARPGHVVDPSDPWVTNPAMCVTVDPYGQPYDEGTVRL